MIEFRRIWSFGRSKPNLAEPKNQWEPVVLPLVDVGTSPPMPAHPGDGGLCPICNEDMRAKAYSGKSIFDAHDGVVLPREYRGRYWHMVNEHGIYEHYTSL